MHQHEINPMRPLDDIGSPGTVLIRLQLKPFRSTPLLRPIAVFGGGQGNDKNSSRKSSSDSRNSRKEDGSEDDKSVTSARSNASNKTAWTNKSTRTYTSAWSNTGAGWLAGFKRTSSLSNFPTTNCQHNQSSAEEVENTETTPAATTNGTLDDKRGVRVQDGEEVEEVKVHWASALQCLYNAMRWGLLPSNTLRRGLSSPPW